MMNDMVDSRQDTIFDRASTVLRIGFLMAAVLAIIGVVWSLIERRVPDERVLPFVDLPRALLDGNPTAVIDLGILVLLATPVALVLIIAREFAYQQERRFTIASLLVLAILAFSIGSSLFR